MGHTAHPRNQLKSMNTFEQSSVYCMVEIGVKLLERKLFKFVNIFSLFRNYIPLEKGRGPSFEQTWLPFSQGWFLSRLVEIDPLVLEKKIFNLSMYIRNFFYYIPLEKGGALHLNKYDPTSPKNSWCQVWLKLALWLKMWNVYDSNNDNDSNNDDGQRTNSDQKSLLEPQVS